jgi:hypothetical protein
MKERFVFLEITDPDVNALVAEIRSIVGGSPLMRPAHLTIRGPYARSVPHQVLSRCNAAMSHDVLRIYGAGRFSNGEKEVMGGGNHDLGTRLSKM